MENPANVVPFISNTWSPKRRPANEAGEFWLTRQTNIPLLTECTLRPTFPSLSLHKVNWKSTQNHWIHWKWEINLVICLPAEFRLSRGLFAGPKNYRKAVRSFRINFRKTEREARRHSASKISRRYLQSVFCLSITCWELQTVCLLTTEYSGIFCAITSSLSSSPI